MEDYKKYERFPIELSSNCMMLIHLFSDRESSLRNVFESQEMFEESKPYFDYSIKESRRAAEQLFKQLEGKYCAAFLEAVIIEATKLLTDGDNRNNAMSKKLNRPERQSRAKEALDKAAELGMGINRKVLIEKFNK